MGSFDGVAEIYEKSRHGYPTEFRDHLVEIGALTPGSVVVDLGAGTDNSPHRSPGPLTRRHQTTRCGITDGIVGIGLPTDRKWGLTPSIAGLVAQLAEG